MSIKTTVRGDGPPYAPIKVYQDGGEVSSHVEEREAIEKCSKLLDENPNSKVMYQRILTVDVEAIAPVPSPEPEPEPIVKPVWEERWRYANTAEMQAARRNPVTGEGHFIEDTLTPPGVPGNGIVLSRTPGIEDGILLLSFGSRQANDGKGESMVGKNVLFPKSVLDLRLREAWFGFSSIFSQNFKTKFPGQTSNPDYKYLFFSIQGPGNRIEFKPGFNGDKIKAQIEVVLQDHQQIGDPNEPPMLRRPPTTGAFVPFSEVVTGNKLTNWMVHLKLSSRPNLADGAYEVWKEGEKVFAQVPIYTGTDLSTILSGLNLGRNLNQIPTEAQVAGFGPLAVYAQNPNPAVFK